MQIKNLQKLNALLTISKGKLNIEPVLVSAMKQPDLFDQDPTADATIKENMKQVGVGFCITFLYYDSFGDIKRIEPLNGKSAHYCIYRENPDKGIESLLEILKTTAPNLHKEVMKLAGILEAKVSLTDEEKTLAQAGKKPAAIQSIRSRTGCGLREAHDLYTAYHQAIFDSQYYWRDAVCWAGVIPITDK